LSQSSDNYAGYTGAGYKVILTPAFSNMGELDALHPLFCSFEIALVTRPIQ
jgi:hypothetical protein